MLKSQQNSNKTKVNRFKKFGRPKQTFLKFYRPKQNKIQSFETKIEFHP